MSMAWLALAVLAMAAGIPAKSASAEDVLNDTQSKGRQLFEQSCGVCHTKPTYVAPLYGPALSKDSLNGAEDALLSVIADGTPRMPGFKHTYTAIEIKAIIAYLKTMPVPPPEKETAPAVRPTRDVD